MNAVIAVINYNGKIVLGKKRPDSKKFLAGMWHVPGENVENGESDEATIIRGVREELGLKVKVGKYIGKHLTPTGKEARWYECFANSDNAIPFSDIEEIKWVSKKEVLNICSERVCSSWPKEIISYFTKE